MVNATTRYCPDAVWPNSFHRLSRLMVLAGMVTYLPPVTSSTFERRYSIAHDVTHVGVVPIEAPDLIQHTLVYTTHVCTEKRPCRANLHDWKSSEQRPNVSNGRDKAKWIVSGWRVIRPRSDFEQRRSSTSR